MMRVLSQRVCIEDRKTGWLNTRNIQKGECTEGGAQLHTQEGGIQNDSWRDFPDGPVVKTPHSQCMNGEIVVLFIELGNTEGVGYRGEVKDKFILGHTEF